MAPRPAWLKTALEHQRAGRLADADRICEDVLRANPSEADALHLRGLIAAHGEHYEQAGRLIARSAREALRLAAVARASARGRGAQAKLSSARKLEELAGRCRRVAEQIDRRARNLKITDRLVSISDPDARPIRKGKLGKPTEFGYVAQICEVTENTRKGARGFILPASHLPGNPAENRLLDQTVKELARAGIRPREVVLDGGFMPGPTHEAFPDLTDDQIQIAGRHEPGSRRTRKRRARYRTGIE